MRRIFDSKAARFSGAWGIVGSLNRGAVYVAGRFVVLCSPFGIATCSLDSIELTGTLAGDLSLTILNRIAQ
jgi:hypothetical protein